MYKYIYKYIIDYFEKNQNKDYITLASRLIAKLMNNYNNIEDKILLLELLEIAHIYFRKASYDDYNQQGKKIGTLEDNKKNEVLHLLSQEFLLN